MNLKLVKPVVFRNLITCLLILGLNSVRAEIPETDVFLDTTTSQNTLGTVDASIVLRQRAVNIEFDGISPQSEVLYLNLFEDVYLTAVLDYIETDSSGQWAWTGTIDGINDSHVSFVVSNNRVSGTINLADICYHIRHVTADLHVIREIDAPTLQDILDNFSFSEANETQVLEASGTNDDELIAGQILSNATAALQPFEEEVLNIVNQERAVRNLNMLSAEASLTNAARAHSQDMSQQGYFSHTSQDGRSPGQRISDAGYSWNTFGENIAAGFSTPEAVMNAWMNSSGHRANILQANFCDVGVGYEATGLYWTQDFGRKQGVNSCPTPTPTGSGSTVIYRVNSGGGLVSDAPDWETDTRATPSTFVNAAATGNRTFSISAAIDLSDPSIPVGTPEAIFQSERWDPSAAAEMQWNFPVTPGSYEVRLYFAEIFSATNAVGGRVFDVSIEGTVVLDDYDIFADVGGFTGVVQSFVVTSDSTLDIDFGHEVDNPAIKGIEIIQLGSGNPSVLTASPTKVNFADVVVGNIGSRAVQLTNAGTADDPDIVVSEVLISGMDSGEFSEDFVPNVILAPGESTTVNAEFFAENPLGSKSASLDIIYDSSVLSVALTGNVITAGSGGSPVIYRVNSGGGLISATPDWGTDTQANPSSFVNAAATGNKAFTIGAAIDLSDPSIPAGTPEAIFQSERWDPSAAPEMQWNFPVTPGSYEVRLYFAEIFSATNAVGARVFDVSIEGTVVLKEYDTFADVGGFTGVMQSFVVTSDSNLDIDFNHVIENPTLKAIEIIRLGGSGWQQAAPLPIALGEVAAGVIGNILYLIGEGGDSTLAYDVLTNTWGPLGSLPSRPFTGHHHAADVVDGNWYVIGGLGASSGGRVQIYDPSNNDWTEGARCPSHSGSAASAVIGGKIYYLGGIVSSTTVDQVYAYDPVNDNWSGPLAPMPQGVNHAAAATDGSKLYVFGGRDGGNVVANGFDHVQIYDPVANSWESSTDLGSILAPLPQARGGMGKAVFFNGEFYVFGGETNTGAGATNGGVYDRVDIYDPVTNTWRLGDPMPTARHGIFPLLHTDQIYVAGGGVKKANSQSTIFEVYTPN